MISQQFIVFLNKFIKLWLFVNYDEKICHTSKNYYHKGVTLI